MKTILLALLMTVLFPVLAAAQGTGFSFQGRLNDGLNPANGAYDLEFRLCSAIMGGTQIGTVVSRPNTALINGVFSVMLDFGSTAFNDPNAVFIEIAVRPNGSPNAYTVLGPCQQLTVVPLAVRANNAHFADTAGTAVTAIHSDFTDSAIDSSQLGGVSSTGYVRLNFVNTGDLKIAGELSIDGNARQLTTSNGLAKAMIFYDGTTIVRCYNSVTNSNVAPCGFTVDKMSILTGGPGTLLHYRVDFGFAVNSRFFSVTAQAAPYRTATVVSNNNDPRNGCGPNVVMNANTQCISTQDPDEAHLPFYLIVY